MADEKRASDVDAILKSLGDKRSLGGRGIADEWVQHCAELVTQYRDLQSRFRELEAELSDADPSSPGDTVVL